MEAVRVKAQGEKVILRGQWFEADRLELLAKFLFLLFGLFFLLPRLPRSPLCLHADRFAQCATAMSASGDMKSC